MELAQEILETAARNHSDVSARILEEALRLAKEDRARTEEEFQLAKDERLKMEEAARLERSKTTDFDYLSKIAWKALNVTYRKLKGSHQYDMAGEAANTVVNCIDTISEGCPDTASYETKANALETFQKIGKSEKQSV